MKVSMFDRYGGFGSVHKVVMSFYDKMLDSDVAGPYFDDVDMAALMDHQTKFISQVMGGPASYSNEVLEQVHRRYDISQAAFVEMTNLLETTLFEFNFEADDVKVIMTQIRGCQPYIVSKG